MKTQCDAGGPVRPVMDLDSWRRQLESKAGRCGALISVFGAGFLGAAAGAVDSKPASALGDDPRSTLQTDLLASPRSTGSRPLPNQEQLKLTERARVHPVINNVLAVSKDYFQPITVDFGGNFEPLYRKALGKAFDNPNPEYKKEADFLFADTPTDFPGVVQLWNVTCIINGKEYKLRETGGDIEFSKNRFSVPLFNGDPTALANDSSERAQFRQFYLNRLIESCPDNRLPTGAQVVIPRSFTIKDAQGKVIEEVSVNSLKVRYDLKFSSVEWVANNESKVPQQPVTTLMTEADLQRGLEAGGVAQFGRHPAVIKFLMDRNPDLIRREGESDLTFAIRATRAASDLIGKGPQDRPDFRTYGMPPPVNWLSALDASEKTCSNGSLGLTTVLALGGVKTMYFEGQASTAPGAYNSHGRPTVYLRNLGWVALESTFDSGPKGSPVPNLMNGAGNWGFLPSSPMQNIAKGQLPIYPVFEREGYRVVSGIGNVLLLRVPVRALIPSDERRVRHDEWCDRVGLPQYKAIKNPSGAGWIGSVSEVEEAGGMDSKSYTRLSWGVREKSSGPTMAQNQ